MRLTEDQIRQYHEEGYLVVPSLIPPEHLALLRDAAQATIVRDDARMDAAGVDRLELNLRGVRYFSINPSYMHPEIYRFSCSDLMADIARQLLGETVHAFFEQFVLKGPEASDASRFSWHQDSAYVASEHPRYLTCWCALDDVGEHNGTARILPFSRGPSDLVPHTQDPESNDLIGYDGDDPGEPVTCPAGSVAFFTSHTLHCSGNNPSGCFRRVYLIQYSSEVIRSPEDGSPYARHEPLYIDGRRILRAD